jgi:SAM-dependent methyltransferase
MRVVDLDRDMRDVIPTGTTRDSEYLFERMTRRTLELAGGGPGRRILDVASGFGQDATALADSGAWVVGAEPSARMSALASMACAEREGALPGWVRAWSDVLPFADGTFDGVFCKGAIDHFDRPELAISEMSRVTRTDGCVVLAIANFDSFSCRSARALDGIREGWLGARVPRGRRHYDVPHDHFTRYDLDLMREQAGPHLDLDVVEGLSLAWGAPFWSRTLQRLPESVADVALEGLGWLAQRLPMLADVVLLAGRPKRQPRASAAGRSAATSA